LPSQKKDIEENLKKLPQILKQLKEGKTYDICGAYTDVLRMKVRNDKIICWNSEDYSEEEAEDFICEDLTEEGIEQALLKFYDI
jgi:hypothetical protein